MCVCVCVAYPVLVADPALAVAISKKKKIIYQSILKLQKLLKILIRVHFLRKEENLMDECNSEGEDFNCNYKQQYIPIECSKDLKDDIKYQVMTILFSYYF